ncbi:hypothetical protein V7654_01645 [Bacillus sp. JJ1609]|uniref:hypothetical protein n=1 Tax=Bacillus sp. JJ1609 TaxID=3122977 RepID=UPI0030006D00
MNVKISYISRAVVGKSRHFTFEDSDARWQIAFGLGKINAVNNEVLSLLKQLLEDEYEYEYVKRRAYLSREKKI